MKLLTVYDVRGNPKLKKGRGGVMEGLAQLVQEIGLTAVLLLGAGIYFYRLSMMDRADKRETEKRYWEQTAKYTEAVTEFRNVIHENNGIIKKQQEIIVQNQTVLEQNQLILNQYSGELRSMREDINVVSNKVDNIQSIMLLR